MRLPAKHSWSSIPELQPWRKTEEECGNGRWGIFATGRTQGSPCPVPRQVLHCALYPWGSAAPALLSLHCLENSRSHPRKRSLKKYRFKIISFTCTSWWVCISRYSRSQFLSRHKVFICLLQKAYRLIETSFFFFVLIKLLLFNACFYLEINPCEIKQLYCWEEGEQLSQFHVFHTLI